jgi:hypothetical protein
MRCLRCNNLMFPETIFAEGYWIDQNRCYACGEILFVREPLEAPKPERRTGRGRDNHKRQSYGVSKMIRPEDWILPNSAMADLYGLAETTISHNRPNKRTCRHRGRLGYPEIPSEAPRIEAEGH